MRKIDAMQGRAEKETKQRLEAMFRGAFAGPPTPLKDIPKRNGMSRSIKKVEAKKRSRKK
jgi:hypothetical protein